MTDPRDFPMPDWLARRARTSPTHPALIHGGQRWSYAELDAWAATLAGRLRAAGVEPGQHVAVLLPNSPEFIVLIHALIRLGALLVPLNLRLTADELRWQVEESESDWLVYGETTAVQAAAVNAGGCRSLGLDDLPGPDPFSLLPFDLSSPLAILFTSGTTGRPKGAVQTLGNHFWGAVASALRLGTLPDDRWLLTIPLYHVGGLAIPLRCCLYGTSVVLPATASFEPEILHADMHRQAVTLVSLVPTMLQRLLDDHPKNPFPASLRLILLGGAAAPSKLLERAAGLDLPLALTYGLTETASQVATALPGLRKPGSAGKPLMFTRISVQDENGRELHPGETGEIVVSGPTVTPGYYRHSEQTGGTFRTGDLGYLDEDGDLWVVQRRSDLIVSGGENVYPAEVERVLLEHPSVREACVVGVDDERWGQQVAAALVLQPGAELREKEIQDFCRERLAGYKLPRLIRFLPELPRTASGKIRRPAVRGLWDSPDE